MAFVTPVQPRNRANRQRVIARSRYLAGDASTHLDNISAMLDAATPEEWRDGLTWYATANDISQLVGELTFGRQDAHATIKGAAIVAALSPQVDWDTNVNRAISFARGEEIAGLSDGIGKARRIADNGENPALVLGGRKVRSFWHNICGNSNAVTIDRHAVAIAVGRPVGDAYAKCLERLGCYQQIAAAYRTVARRLDLQPCQVQAITWLAWRRLHAYDRKEEF